MENHTLIRSVLMTVFISGLISCSDELDMSGLFISPDQVNERFEQSVEWNSMHAGKVIDLDTVSYTFLAAGEACKPVLLPSRGQGEPAVQNSTVPRAKSISIQL